MKDIELYKEAFMGALKCKEDDFEIKKYYGDTDRGPMIAQYKGKIYKVCSLDNLYERAHEYLTTMRASELQPFTLSEIMENIHTNKDFYFRIFNDLDEKNKQELSFVFGIHNAIKEDFWSVLYKYVSEELYVKAIYTARDFYKLDVLKSDLVEEWTGNGKELLCEFTNGIYVKYPLINKKGEEEDFFVYSVDVDWKDSY